MAEQQTDHKITVTWDDLATRKVEKRLKEQDALARNRDYARMDEGSLPQGAAPAAPSAMARLWRNGIFALAVFGLAGGLLAWACGASLQFRADLKADAERRMAQIHEASDRADKGTLTREQADAVTAELLAAGRQQNRYFEVLTDPKYADTTVSETIMRERVAERERRLAEIAAQDRLTGLIRNVLAYGIMGVMIALFLAIALPVTEKNLPAVVINGSVGAALGLAGGIVVSLLVDRVFQAVAVGPDGQTDPGRQVLARVAVWGMMGLFLTIAPGIVMRNGKKFVIGLLGGLIGGLIGGGLYDTVAGGTAHGTRLAELVGLGSIGLVAGLATGLIENAAKTGWLRVTQGLIAGKQFILYRNPTFVGSGPDCQIYLFRDPKVGRRHAAIHIVPGGFELEDLPLGEPTFVNGRPVARTRLKNGDRLQIGSTQLVFQEKAPAA